MPPAACTTTKGGPREMPSHATQTHTPSTRPSLAGETAQSQHKICHTDGSHVKLRRGLPAVLNFQDSIPERIILDRLGCGLLLQLACGNGEGLSHLPARQAWRWCAGTCGSCRLLQRCTAHASGCPALPAASVPAVKHNQNRPESTLLRLRLHCTSNASNACRVCCFCGFSQA